MSDLISLKGRVALVTGASSGIGAHAARTLAKAGARVAVAARRKDRLDSLVAGIQAAGGEALAVVMDVQDNEGVSDAFDPKILS